MDPGATGAPLEDSEVEEMDAQVHDRIRVLAFELSQLPGRARMNELDNWLEAERAILSGLAEDGALYEPAPNTIEETPIPRPAGDDRGTNGADADCAR